MKSVLIYGITFAMSLILCYIYEKRVDKNSLKNRFIWTLLIIAPTVILAGIRFDVGIDYLSYESDFYQNKFEIGFKYYIKEPLNFLLNVIVYQICPNAVAMFFVYAFITMFVFFKAIDYYRDRMSLTLALFIFYMTYYLVSYNVIRQMIAVVIILYATRYIFEKKFWEYLLCVVVAGMMHKSAYLMIVLYFFYDENLRFLKKVKLSKKFNISISENLQSIIIYGIIGLLPLLLVPLIPKITNFLGIYRGHLLKETHMSFKFLLYVLPILTLIFVYRKEILKESKSNEFFIQCMILQIPFQLMGGMIKYVDRFSLYFAIMQIVLIPILFYNLGNSKMDKFIKMSIIGWYLFYFTVMIIILKSNGVMPYQTIFNQEMVESIRWKTKMLKSCKAMK